MLKLFANCIFYQGRTESIIHKEERGGWKAESQKILPQIAKNFENFQLKVLHILKILFQAIKIFLNDSLKLKIVDIFR